MLAIFSAIDRYFGWLAAGGIKRLALGLGLPVFVVLIIAAIALGGAGEEPTETSTASADTAPTGSSTEPASSAADAPQPTRPAASPTPRPTVPFIPTATPSPPLTLVSAECLIDRFGYVTCEGFVKNTTSQPIEGLTVYIIWVDDGGTPRSSEWSFVDYDPILPGQQSPWSVFDTANPELTRFRVEFREFLGGTVPYHDAR